LNDIRAYDDDAIKKYYPTFVPDNGTDVQTPASVNDLLLYVLDVRATTTISSVGVSEEPKEQHQQVSSSKTSKSSGSFSNEQKTILIKANHNDEDDQQYFRPESKVEKSQKPNDDKSSPDESLPINDDIEPFDGLLPELTFVHSKAATNSNRQLNGSIRYHKPHQHEFKTNRNRHRINHKSGSENVMKERNSTEHSDALGTKLHRKLHGLNKTADDGDKHHHGLSHSKSFRSPSRNISDAFDVFIKSLMNRNRKFDEANTFKVTGEVDAGKYIR